MNWGYKLMVAFIVFAGMMSYMVIRSFQTNFELVEKDYYKSELVYQKIIDGADRANTLSALPEIKQSGSDIMLQMPGEMKNKQLSGSILFYCAYDSKKDKKILLATDKDGIQVLTNLLQRGNYTVKIDWNKEGKNYYSEKKLTIL
jgi:delta-aminolevulinic acid dehydratase/porphobilinogen synthase